MADTDDVNASGTIAPASAASSSAAVASSLGFILVTRFAFADYQVGDEITDEDEIKDILAGELAVYVIKRAA
ncbi:hypothetical protein [Serratia sp. M24T3]|uniref:hypothetical protein n=1 Tax=Serratia sp. M24T3 TaxID=932213 RepID=UPI00025BBA76|nr:hypothetical protein [Serratia sp. M24T3]EIC83377.1 hypothetical protein SPM24T3_17240 [Serratia sp. M24T3]